ncbi:long-chain acyl-CoA synthetase [Collimonas sp. OK307]|uniref:long-chain-fatty-acid--CoA ligase n=1 Tax=Collimonas sp. OK307 TaxID=1801620 RepID=UPI0008E5E0EC|nr:long-chain-fatty-acid--CoA ligase [Collimonas sp. OK307]SFI31952.1 long-chain acyl-CoA synthetase [Collimonas sp. OK307]
MEKVWLKSYPPSVPTKIDAQQYRSVVHMLEESFTKYKSRDAYVCMGTFMSYRELDEYSKRMAAWLQGCRMKKGARIAVMLPNILQYPIAAAAILRAGFIVVNVNPLYTPRELLHQLNDAGAQAIIVLENFATTLEQVLAQTEIKHIVVASMGDLLGGLKGTVVNFMVRKVKKMVPAFNLPGAVSFLNMLSIGASSRFSQVHLCGDDVAFLQYTGGTTGVSKGATLTHRNIIANVLQNDAWVRPAQDKVPVDQPMTIVCALPLYHIFALTACSLMGTRWGALNILIPNPRDITNFIKELRKYKFNMFPAVNTLYNGLLNHPDFAKLDFSGLKISLGGGMAVQRAVAEQWMKVTGCPILEAYGLSETSPGVTINRADATAFTGTIGLPLPSTEVAILDENGKLVDHGTPGEIAVRGPQVMVGYWNNPGETAKAINEDGFFKTGDIGIMDERGYIRIVDRKKDMILVSGFNVYPNEIEDVMAMHPGVLECACVGVPDQNAGEAIKLFVVRRDRELTAEQVMDFCKTQLTGYKKPKYIVFRADLPKSNVGKILRRELRDET